MEEVVDQWSGRDDSFYKARADDGNTYLLRHHTTDDTWSIESVQKLR